MSRKSDANALEVFVVAARRECEAGIEDMVTILTADFGLIESLCGLAQKLIGIDILGLGIAGDAGAG